MTSVGAGPRFAFGRNWADFVARLDERQIEAARISLVDMLDRDSLAGSAFLDVGCGSGLFSLGALELGARRVHSFDFDTACVDCARSLRRPLAPELAERWTIERGDVLDRDYMSSQGLFDVVYAWGSLHHTGDMWNAVDAAVARVAPGGRLFLSIYNDQGRKSHVWRSVKRAYNRLPPALRPLVVLAVAVPLEARAVAADLVRGRPFGFLSRWAVGGGERGMSRWNDLVDWVGGYPFEVAKPEEVLAFCRRRGFDLERLETCGGGLGCNQFVFRRRDGA